MIVTTMIVCVCFMNTCTSCDHINVCLQICIYTSVLVRVNYSLTKASIEAETSEQFCDYSANVLTNIEHNSKKYRQFLNTNRSLVKTLKTIVLHSICLTAIVQ